MPIYEYACEKCGSEFELERRITDAPVKICPSCKSRKIKRLISRTSFVLKGGGWYSDLYASSSGKPDPNQKSDSSDTGSASESADAKAGTPSEAKSPDTNKVKDRAKATTKDKRKGSKAAS